jgi:hypothetical protein
MRLELGTEHEKTQCMHEESITVTAPGFVVKRGVSQGELWDFDFEIALKKNGFSRCYMFLPWLKHRLVRLEDVWSHMVCTHAIEARGTCEGRQLLPETLAWKISTAPQPALAGSLCEYSVTTTTNANCEWNAMCEKMRYYRCLIININFINIVHTSPMHANSMYCEKFTTHIHVN